MGKPGLRKVTTALRQGHLLFLTTLDKRVLNNPLDSNPELTKLLSSQSQAQHKIRQDAKHSNHLSLLIQQHSVNEHKQRSNLEQRFVEKDGLCQGGGNRSGKSGGHHGKPSGFPDGLEMKGVTDYLSSWKSVAFNGGMGGGYKWDRVQFGAC